MKSMTRLALVLSVVLVAGMAWAQAGPGGGGGAAGRGGQGAGVFQRQDVNGDGAISRDEWPGRAEAFDKMDANGDGKIDNTEFAVARQQAMGRRAQTGEGGQPGQEGGRQAGERGGPRDGRERPSGGRAFCEGVFLMLDANGDGQVSQAEHNEFTAMVAGADADKNGKVNRDEACEVMEKRMRARAGEGFMRRFDKNGDGRVTPEEFGGNEERFKRLDTNGDGVVTPDDLSARGPAGPARRGEPGARRDAGQQEWPGIWQGSRRPGGGQGRQRRGGDAADEDVQPQ